MHAGPVDHALSWIPLGLMWNGLVVPVSNSSHC